MKGSASVDFRRAINGFDDPPRDGVSFRMSEVAYYQVRRVSINGIIGHVDAQGDVMGV